jgi:hypothetical protein
MAVIDETSRLSEIAQARIESARCELHALVALEEIADLLDPAGVRSRWALAT